MNEDAHSRTSIAWRLVAVACIAALAGWGVNALVVDALERHEPNARKGYSLPSLDLDALLGGSSSQEADRRALEALFQESDRTDDGRDTTPPTVSEEAVTPHEPAAPDAPSDKPGASRSAKTERTETTPTTEKEPEETRPHDSADRADAGKAPTPEEAVEEEPAEQPRDDGPKFHVFSVDKKAISAQVDSLEELARHGRIAPHYVDGARSGMRIVDITEGGVFDRLGVEEGDAVRSVNGKTINTQYNALDAIDKMRDARRFDVILERDGQQRHHRYLVN